MDHLVGTQEIAARLNVKHVQTVNTWRRRYNDFPAPVATVGGNNVWNWPDVEAWAKKTGHPR